METKDLIREIRISDTIERFITITRKGTMAEATCPFHNDTKSSLKINDNKGLFKCFTCGVGGDVVTFVMTHQKISYPDALSLLGIFKPLDGK